MMNALETAKDWSKNKSFEKQTQIEAKRILEKNDEVEIEDCFANFLEFGTGGLRGIMGVGTNRINQYTIQMVTEGLSRIIKKSLIPPKKNSVVIGYDSRNHSFDFAKKTCEVLLAHGLKVSI